MRYLVSKQMSLFECEEYSPISVEGSLELLSKKKEIGVDTETMGLDPYTKRLLSLQLGDFDEQVFIDCTTIDVHLYKPLLESEDHLFLFWNAKFDLKFLMHKGIFVQNVWDGFLAEKQIWFGYPSGMHGMGLADAGRSYLGIELDKSVRGEIITKGVTPRVVIYGCDDVKYLPKIKEEQNKILDEKGLQVSVMLENEFVKPLTYMEYCGVGVDIDKWAKKCEKDRENLIRAREALDKAVIEYSLSKPQEPKIFYTDKWASSKEEMREYKRLKKKYRVLHRRPDLDKMDDSGGSIMSQKIAYECRAEYHYIRKDTQGDLFGEDKGEYKCIIDWNSSLQVIPLMEELGVDVKVEDKSSSRGYKKTVEAKKIGPQKWKHPIIELYLEYKGQEKQNSTYGMKFLDKRNPVTGRLHSNFGQLGTDTGRISSSEPNMQNLPRDKETRACFVSKKGNLFISQDYKGQESVLMADMSKDKAMIDEYIHGSGDMHSLVARMVFKELYDKTTEWIKKNAHELRGKAKGYEFLWNYGGDWHTLMSNFGLTEERAKELDRAYRSGFRGLIEWQAAQKRAVMQRGYILINPITGLRANIYDFEELINIRDDKDLWATYHSIPRNSRGRKEPRDYEEKEALERISHYNKRKADSEKQSINYPVQGSGAIAIKIAWTNFYNICREKGWLTKVLFCIQIHDELCIEAPENIAREAANLQAKCMREAGDILTTTLHLDVDEQIGDHWIH